jgi:ubiquinone/menaquinone biosynthesis C-methylase UbiE
MGELFTNSDYAKWDKIYRQYPLSELGWELGKPRPILVEFIEAQLVKPGKALDLCCGVGTNTIFLAEQNFEITGMDISKTAIRLFKAKLRKDVSISLGLHSFVMLPFRDEVFDFVYDMGCFHHVHPEDRSQFVLGIRRVLKNDGSYMLTCFSYKNGPGWNHFTRKQLRQYFSGLFTFQLVRHYASVEGDGYNRFFYTILMIKKKNFKDAT